METVSLTCRKCKKKVAHTLFSDLSDMPNHGLVQCRTCGVMGVEELEKTKDADV